MSKISHAKTLKILSVSTKLPRFTFNSNSRAILLKLTNFFPLVSNEQSLQSEQHPSLSNTIENQSKH